MYAGRPTNENGSTQSGACEGKSRGCGMVGLIGLLVAFLCIGLVSRRFGPRTRMALISAACAATLYLYFFGS